MNVTIKLKSAELIRAWLKDLMAKLHMIPEQAEYAAFLDLHGAIEDSHYEEKRGIMGAQDEKKDINTDSDSGSGVSGSSA